MLRMWDANMAETKSNIFFKNQMCRTQTMLLRFQVQWVNHPEVTLGFTPRTPPADCALLGKWAALHYYFVSFFIEKKIMFIIFFYFLYF
jgi:hypothetical protein